MLSKTLRAKLALAGAFGLALSLGLTPAPADAGNHGNKVPPGQAKNAGNSGGGNGGSGQGGSGQGGSGQGGSGQSSSDGDLIERSAEILTDAFLTDRERTIIRDAFRGGYPEGFQKPKPIPPGIQKKLARGGTLPPGIAKTRMPDGLQSRLPRRDGQEIIFIDDDAYLIQRSTEVILDVLENVL